MIDPSRGATRVAVAVVLAIAAAFAPRVVGADEELAPAPRAIAYALWDEELLFLGARVDDVNIIGTNDDPMSEAWRDDSVEFYLDLNGRGGDTIHPACARVSVSAAGGFTCLVGTTAGTWSAQQEWLMGLKLGVERDGTLNRSDDVDTGYVVELGIPWRFLGGAPKPGRRIGFNFVVNVRGENEALVSWSSRAQSRDDLERPRLWGSMALSPTSKPAIAENDVLICPRTYKPPLVDGQLGAGEWLAASVIQLEKPQPELVFQPAAGKADARLFATYRYDYQVLPLRPGAQASSALSLAHQPPDGIGSWFSAASVAWHKDMIRQARQAAIDTILPVYRGDPAARREWSRLGLLRLMQALKETKDERLSYPLVGMYLDPTCLAEVGAADLTSTAAKQALWAMIAEFFSIVPEEFRAQFDIASGERTNLVVLGPPRGMEEWDDAFADYCRQTYRQACGARLLIIGDAGWRAKAPNLDGYCSLAPGVGMSFDQEGPRSVLRLTPGCVGPDSLLPRHGGDDYERNWMRALAVLPDFVLVDSLNDFAAGSEIAASRQYGARFLDITRQSAQVLAGRREHQVAIRRETLPAVFHPGATYDIELLVDNQGFQDLVERQNVEISYVLQNKHRPDARRTGVASSKLYILAGQRAPIVVKVSTRLVEGPLPVGDYDLSFELSKSTIPILRSRWFARRLFEVSFPVRVDRARANRATVLSTGLPSAMGTGVRRRVRVRLRNDGSRAWSARECALSYHWVRAASTSSLGGMRPEAVEWEGVRTPLPQDVQPGEMITMHAWVETRTASGEPLVPWTPQDDWLYQLQWDLVEGEDRWFSRLGDEAYAEAVAVLPSDLGATVVDADVPPQMQAGETYPVKVAIRNDGSATWEPESCNLSYHWHYWDGTEAPMEPLVTALPDPVAAGDAALVTAQVTAPDSAGSYRLAWDLVFEGERASHMTDAGSRNLLVQPVAVTGCAYQPLDLSEYFNLLVSTFDRYRSRGAFDAAGFSFPAEHVPPDTATGTVQDYPGAYYTGARGAEAARVPLRYPSMDQRGGAAVACASQRIPLPEGRVRSVYLAASSSAAIEAEFRLLYADGTSSAMVLSIPGWTDEPPPGLAVAVRTPHVRGSQEDLARSAHIYLFRLTDPSRAESPAALALPTAPEIKVFAITVERPENATAGGS